VRIELIDRKAVAVIIKGVAEHNAYTKSYLDEIAERAYTTIQQNMKQTSNYTKGDVTIENTTGLKGKRNLKPGDLRTAKNIAKSDHCINVLHTRALFAINRQRQKQDLRALSIGDTMPDVVLTLVDNWAKTIKLSELKGKVIVLYFWSASCAPTVEQLSGIDSMQEEYKDKLAIVAISGKGFGDTEAGIHNLKTKWTKSLRFAKENVKLNKYFPHREVPYFVWIDSDGIVNTITSTNLVTRSVIEVFLNENNKMIAFNEASDKAHL
jgi:thiol-disulfide isomerase/thioredoxin